MKTNKDTVTFELTMPKELYKRYEAVAKKHGDDTVMAIAYALTLLIDKLEEAEVESDE